MGRLIILPQFSYNVSGLPNPPRRAHRLRPFFSANGVTQQGLGGRSEATEAGNPVLCEGGLFCGRDGLSRSQPYPASLHNRQFAFEN